MKKILPIILLCLVYITPCHAADKKFGCLFETAAKNALTAIEAQNGVLLAVDKYNKAYPHSKIQLFPVQTTIDLRTILKSAHKIKQAKVDAVTGVLTDSIAMSAAPVFENAQIPFLTTGAEFNTPKQTIATNFFRLCAPESKVGKAISYFSLKTLKARNIIFIYSTTTDRSNLQAKTFKNHFLKSSGHILAEIKITDENPDINFILDKIAEFSPPPPEERVTPEFTSTSFFSMSDADIETFKREDVEPDFTHVQAIVMITPPQMTIDLLKAFKKENILYQILGSTLFDTVEVQKEIKRWPGTAYFVAQAPKNSPEELNIMFTEAYVKMFGSKPLTSYAALGFDSIMLLAKSAGESGNFADHIRINLPSMKKFHGVCGMIDFANKYSDKYVYIVRSESGAISTVSGLK